MDNCKCLLLYGQLLNCFHSWFVAQNRWLCFPSLDGYLLLQTPAGLERATGTCNATAQDEAADQQILQALGQSSSSVCVERA